MRTGGIDSSQIQSMIAQLKAAATRPQATPPVIQTEQPAAKVDFSQALKGALDSVQDSQTKAEGLSKRFQLGDDSVNLSDVMIAQQKASINFQATLQVRNKLVQSYHDIMNMQV